jgi:hypothetical protein
MMQKMGLLDQLRALPSMVRLSPQQQYFFSLLPCGMPKAGLVEFSGASGAGKTESILYFLNENPNLEVAWIEKEFTIHPPAFSHFKVALDRVLFIDTSSPGFKQTPFWCASQILKSRLFQVLVISHIEFSEIDFRRFQLAAKQYGVLVILLRVEPLLANSWSVVLQVQVKRAENLDCPRLKVLKSKGFSVWNSGEVVVEH